MESTEGLLKEILRQLEKPSLKVYSLNQATEVTGIGIKTLRKGIETGTLDYMKTGRITYVSEDALKRFVESNIEFI